MLRSLPIRDVKITDPFFTRRIDQIIDVTLPYVWECLNDRVPGVPESHCIQNFEIAAGLREGEFKGYPFQDGGMYKWMQSASFSLEIRPNPKFEEILEYCIDLMEKVQLEDGYLDTYYSIHGLEKRWTDVRQAHELCLAGYIFETAAAYYRATGKDRIVKIARKLADHIDSVFGPEEGKLKGYPGHQEVEIGLVKLYEITGEKRYLNLAKFFLDERGKQPYFYDLEAQKRGDTGDTFFNAHGTMRYSYQQAHLPVRQQKKAVGHAVRAGYMYTSMAEVGDLTGDRTLVEAAKVLWEDVVNRQMYIVGGVGSMMDGEAFTFDYDLPNDHMYIETCANIALMKFGQRLQKIEHRGEYADVVELALYNSVLSGIQLDGTKFFYVNPMEMWPERSERRHDMRSAVPVRQGWYGCACCPPNVVRTVVGLSEYIYAVDADSLYVNLFVGSEVRARLGGKPVKITQQANYPWSGKMVYRFESEGPVPFTFAVRVPQWAEGAKLRVNGEPQDLAAVLKDGYAVLNRTFAPQDEIVLELPMKARVMRCSGHVPYNAGKAAVKRGPVVYCLEECDNGKELWNLTLDEQPSLQESFEENLLGGVVTVTAKGMREGDRSEDLYYEGEKTRRPVSLKFVPYYAWSNRESGEMTVWVRQN